MTIMRLIAITFFNRLTALIIIYVCVWEIIIINNNIYTVIIIFIKTYN